MKGKLVTIGPENDVMNRFVSGLTAFGFKLESYVKADACVNDIVQGFDPDAILIFQQPPDYDAKILGQLLSEEHKFFIPIIVLFESLTIEQLGRLSASPGIYSLFDVNSEIQLINNCMMHASSHKQLFRISQQLLGEGARLTETLETVNEATSGFQTANDENDLTEGHRAVELIKNFRALMRGRDLSIEHSKALKFFENYTGKIEKLRKLSMKC
ncbi:MAG: hypothetical protein ACOH5I_09730 [Oligoflexus sp.]